MRYKITTGNQLISSQTWFRFGITLGMLLACLLLYNSVTNYLVVSRRIAIEHTRREMNTLVAALQRQVGQSPLHTLLAQTRAASEGRIAWLQVRDGEGNILDQDGIPQGSRLGGEKVRERLRSRQPVWETRESSAGDLVVEVFSFRGQPRLAPPNFQAGQQPPSPPGPGGPGGPGRGFGLIEVGAFVDANDASLWILRRNLLINVSAALTLLASLTFMALRFRTYQEGKRLEQQAELARQVQQDLFTTSPIPVPALAVSGECQPASEVGGDFYDVFPLEDGRMGIVVGDVSGKGIPAALLMGVLHGAIRASRWSASPEQHLEATRNINRLLCERASNGRFASMFWGYLDEASSSLSYINAGHFAPLLIREHEMLRLEEGGPVLGVIPRAPYAQGCVQLQAGDTLVLYSDGVIEAADTSGEQFGEHRLAEVVTSRLTSSVVEIRELVFASVRAFTGNAVLDDDRTLLIVRFQGAEAGSTAPELADLAA